jgi:hypothetical protein
MDIPCWLHRLFTITTRNDPPQPNATQIKDSQGRNCWLLRRDEGSIGVWYKGSPILTLTVSWREAPAEPIGDFYIRIDKCYFDPVTITALLQELVLVASEHRAVMIQAMIHPFGSEAQLKQLIQCYRDLGFTIENGNAILYFAVDPHDVASGQNRALP